ncbi:MAG: phosphoglycerate dehydrogenase, partial [Alphaproteobacteria bacterium]|nr:phosphoglycerate dehydrogenase [Alphaproteobacteria bacterium]
MVKVLISDRMSPRAVSIFHDRGIEVDERYDLDPAELSAAISEYDGVAVRSSTKLMADILAKSDRLKVIG